LWNLGVVSTEKISVLECRASRRVVWCSLPWCPPGGCGVQDLSLLSNLLLSRSASAPLSTSEINSRDFSRVVVRFPPLREDLCLGASSSRKIPPPFIMANILFLARKRGTSAALRGETPPNSLSPAPEAAVLQRKTPSKMERASVDPPPLRQILHRPALRSAIHRDDEAFFDSSAHIAIKVTVVGLKCLTSPE
jgi:hypothetical protein